ncbi:MAG: succinate dehydrogenase, cytochrome b556 subunit [Pseudomonadales bacterium]
MQSDRPVNLNLFAFSWPLAALVSITHRITGVVLFVGIGFGLYALQLALSSPEGFVEAAVLLDEPLPKFILLALVFVLVFHIVAGIKHLLLDFHLGDSLRASQIGSWVVILATIVLTALLGVSLW